jgi:hypothetical protein
MSTTAVELAPLATAVSFTADEMVVALADGRQLSVPLAWFPRLAGALPEQLRKFELMGDGEGIHWPELDEDLSVAGSLG